MLQVVDLSNNRLAGALPGAWGRLAFLRRLSLGGNGFVLAVPDEWGALPRLIQL